MTAYVYRPGHEMADEFGMVPKQFAGSRSDRLNSAPYTITDHMDATWHPCDGKKYDSKSEFRKVTRRHGGTEVGTEKITPRKNPYKETPDHVIEHQVRRAIYELENPWARK